MAHRTASSLYLTQCQQVEEAKLKSTDEKHKVKFCLLCDTQYCSANDSGRSNWGDEVTAGMTHDVKAFCVALDILEMHSHEKIPLCNICTMLVSKLGGIKEQLQVMQEQHDKLQLQLSTRAVKTCRKYNYNDQRAVTTTVQHIRRNIFRRWNKDIPTTGTPDLNSQPNRGDNRRKSQLGSRVPTPYSVLPLPQPVTNVHHQPPKAVYKTIHVPNSKHQAMASAMVNPRVNALKNGIMDEGNEEQLKKEDTPVRKEFGLDDIAIVDVKSGVSMPVTGAAEYIEIGDDEPPVLQVEVTTTALASDTEGQDSNDQEPELQARMVNEFLKINQSIFEDESTGDSNSMNVVECMEVDSDSGALSAKAKDTPFPSELDQIKASLDENSCDIVIVEHQDNDGEVQVPESSVIDILDNDESEGTHTLAVASPSATSAVDLDSSRRRFGARERKPTRRAIEGEEVMKTLFSKSKRPRRSTDRSPRSSATGNSLRIATASTSKPPALGGSGPDDQLQYVCEICSKSFRSKERFKEHSDIHAGQAPSCHICQKTFPRKYNLNIHMRTHTGEKPHVCSICEQSYADRSNLNAHLRKHVDKPFNCLICRKMFDTETQAYTHVEQMHPGEPAEDAVLKSSDFYGEDDLLALEDME